MLVQVKQAKRSSDGGHDKNRTEKSTEYRNDKVSRPGYSANGKLRYQRQCQGDLRDKKYTYDRGDYRVREDNLVPPEEVLCNLDKLNGTNQRYYRASTLKLNRALHKPDSARPKVCFNFRNTGKRKYGSSCRFSQNISQSYRNNDVNSTSKPFNITPL